MLVAHLSRLEGNAVTVDASTGEPRHPCDMKHISPLAFPVMTDIIERLRSCDDCLESQCDWFDVDEICRDLGYHPVTVDEALQLVLRAVPGSYGGNS